MSKFGELISTNVPILFNFYTEWDEDCKSMSDVLRDVAAALGDGAKVININVDKNPAIVDALRIRTLPTLIIYKDGDMMWRESGAMDSNRLINTVRQYA